MLVLKILNEAWISIRSNKLRSFLTILGIIIGVCAVVIMVATGQAVKIEINKQLESFGGNKLIAQPAMGDKGGVRGSAKSYFTLTLEDAKAIKGLKDVKYVAPIIKITSSIINDQNNWETAVYGSNEDYAPLDDWTFERGTNFSKEDIENGATVAIIGKTIEKELFANGIDPVGEIIRIKGVPFTIKGVLAEKGGGMGGNDQDDLIVVPIITGKRRLTSNRFPDRIATIMVKAVDEESLEFVEFRMKILLRERHKLGVKDRDDFQILNLKDVLEKVNSISDILSILLASIASISLFVGSIGIMNMMLVSVAERIKEIGIRKAIGGKNKSIMQQFLFESILLSLFGSFIGMLVGVIGSQVLGKVFDKYVPISIITIIVSIVVALIVGVVSGYLPALKATRLDPIDALRV